MALLALGQATDDARPSPDAVRNLSKKFSCGGRTKPVQSESASLDTQAVKLVHCRLRYGADWLENLSVRCYLLDTPTETKQRRRFPPVGTGGFIRRQPQAAREDCRR